MSGVQEQGQGASLSAAAPHSLASAGTPDVDDDLVPTGSLSTSGDATSGAAADCSMATDSEAGVDYNKMKYHSSKMDLKMKILRDQMTNLQSSGSSLSRQLASMYRTFTEIKDDDEAEDADSEYESDDDRRAPDIKDAVDTEDDVNKMSDLEKDYSEPKFKRSISTGSRGKKPKGAVVRDPNANDVVAAAPPSATNGNCAGVRKHDISRSNSRQESTESYPDSDSDCSQCLCCNSVASNYSGTPWRYVSRGGGDGSTMDEDSDSSEYFSDGSEYSTTSNMTSTDLHKRISPFYCPSKSLDIENPVDSDEAGRFEDAEPVNDHRMSPLGCESSGKHRSQTDISDHPIKCDSIKDCETQKVDSASEIPPAEIKEGETPEQEAKASSLIGMFKAQESKAKHDQIASVAKAKRVEELRRKNSDIRIKNEKKRKAELEAKLRDKANIESDSAKSSPLISENEDSEKVDIKNRISSFEKQGKSKLKEDIGKSETGESIKQESHPQMPDLIPESQNGPEAAAKASDNASAGHRSHHHKPKSKMAKTMIEIPVSCLPDQVVNPDSSLTTDQPTMMTFQVRPGDIEAMGGPVLVARSPKPKRRMSKTIVRLSSTEASSPTSLSETTLVSDNDTVRIGVPKSQHGHQHHVCPHCHKKPKSGESKRVVKVLQLQPVPESPDAMSSTSPMSLTPGDTATTQIYQQQQPPSGRVIKMVPSKRHGVVQRQQSGEDGVVFRFNMGMPENAPLQVGDYIRIPIQPRQQQQRQIIQHKSGGGLVIRTGGQPKRQQQNTITFRQSGHPGDIIVQQQQQQPQQQPHQQQSLSTASGVTVRMNQPGVRVLPSEGGGVKLVFGS